MIMNLIFYGITVVCAVLCASLFEWTLHKFVMHKPVGRFRYPYEKHALTHHRIFKADASYHCVRDADKRTIRMAWWNGPVLIIILLLPTALLCIPLGLWKVLLTFGIVSTLYFAAYEYTHWCMHLPDARRRFIERFGAFTFLNGHHLLHHQYPNRNFNVVFPFADLLFGTLLRRAPKAFPQPHGPTVPDVQPLNARPAFAPLVR